MGLDEYDVKHNTSCRPAPNYLTPRNAKVSHATQCCSGMPRNGKSGMDSIKKNCFGDSSVGQRTSHEVIEPLEIGDQPGKFFVCRSHISRHLSLLITTSHGLIKKNVVKLRGKYNMTS